MANMKILAMVGTQPVLIVVAFLCWLCELSLSEEGTGPENENVEGSDGAWGAAC